MATLANLRVNFTANTAGFESGVNRIRSSLGGMLGGMLAVAGPAGLVALTKRSLDAADKIQKLNIQTGLSAEFLSGMRHASELSGTSLDALSTASIKLQRRTEKAIAGTKSYAAAFEALGLSAEKFKTLSPDDQIRAFADAYAKLDDQTVKTTALTELLGVRASELAPLFEQGASGLDAMLGKAKEANQILSQDQVDAAAKTNDALTQLTATWGGLVEQMAVNIAPGLLELLKVAERVLPVLSAIVTTPGKLLGFGAAQIGNLLSGGGAAGFAGAEDAFLEDMRRTWEGAFNNTVDARTEPNRAEVEAVEQQKETNRNLQAITGTLRMGREVIVQ